MAFTTVEWFVLVFSVIALVKLVFVIFKPKKWLEIVKPLYKSSVVLFLVEFVLAVILFYYLLNELTIIQILAGIVLGALLTGMSFALYPKETLDLGRKLLKDKTLFTKAWLPILVWLVLLIWALVSLF